MSPLNIDDWISQLFTDPDLARMGHAQKPDENDLGLGWIYYGLVRVAKPARIVVIGSYRGFVPLVLARALADNGPDEDGRVAQVVFIDPSMVDDFWVDPTKVVSYFESHGLNNINHLKKTTQEFVKTKQYQSLENIGLLFVDGYHSAEQAAFDYNSFKDKLTDRAYVLFHDSVSVRNSKIYGQAKAYDHTVRHFMDELKTDPGLQVFDLAHGSGVTLVQKVAPGVA